MEYPTHLLFPQAFADEVEDSLEQHPRAIPFGLLYLMLLAVVIMSNRRHLCCISHQTEQKKKTKHKFQTYFQSLRSSVLCGDYDISMHFFSYCGDHRLRRGAKCALRAAEQQSPNGVTVGCVFSERQEPEVDNKS